MDLVVGGFEGKPPLLDLRNARGSLGRPRGRSRAFCRSLLGSGTLANLRLALLHPGTAFRHRTRHTYPEEKRRTVCTHSSVNSQRSTPPQAGSVRPSESPRTCLASSRSAAASCLRVRRPRPMASPPSHQATASKGGTGGMPRTRGRGNERSENQENKYCDPETKTF